MTVGHSSGGVVMGTCLGSKIEPVRSKMTIAPQASDRNRLAMLRNLRWVSATSRSPFKRGTATRDRKSMPPTQNVAARR